MSPSAETIRDQLVTLLPRLRRFARALARDAQDADDLVQVAIERALLHLDQLRPEARLESWMFGIVRNAWIDETRSRRRRDQVLAPAELGEQVADSSSEAPIQRLSIEAALERLPEEQRLAIALVLVEGMAYKEAAAVLDVPIGTVTSRLARGRQTLETLLGGREGGV
jgi:RNA polymerase sigma-70 factor (ECF subfamily)